MGWKSLSDLSSEAVFSLGAFPLCNINKIANTPASRVLQSVGLC